MEPPEKKTRGEAVILDRPSLSLSLRSSLDEIFKALDQEIRPAARRVARAGLKHGRTEMDNYRIHKKCDEWLECHPEVTFHYTPAPASWLNLVEVFLGIFTRIALRGASFSSIEELIEAIKDFLEAHNENAEPFAWREREIKGSQLKNSIINFRN